MKSIVIDGLRLPIDTEDDRESARDLMRHMKILSVIVWQDDKATNEYFHVVDTTSDPDPDPEVA
jgi:hypothetical protein